MRGATNKKADLGRSRDQRDHRVQRTPSQYQTDTYVHVYSASAFAGLPASRALFFSLIPVLARSLLIDHKQ